MSSSAGNIARAGRQSLVYGLGSVAGNLLGIVMLRFYTTQLTRVEYADVDYATRLVLLIAIPARLGLIAAFLRFHYDSDDPERRRRFFSSAFWTLQATTIGTALVVIALAPSLGDRVFETPGQETRIFAVMALGIYTVVNWDLACVLFRVQNRPGAFALRTIMNLLLNVALTLFLMLVLHLGAFGSLLGSFAGQAIAYAVVLVEQRRWILGRIERALVRPMLAFGIPLVPSAAAMWLVNVVNRPILRAFSGADAQAPLSFATRIGTAVLLLVTAFNLAWPMVAYAIKDDGEARRTYAAVLRVYLAVMGWIAVCVGLAAPLLVRAFSPGDSYLDATSAVLPIALGAPLYGAFQLAVVTVGREKRNRSTWVVTLVAAVVEIGVLLLLVPRFGVDGAAWGTVVGFGTMLVLMLYSAQRVFPVPYDWSRLARIVAIIAVAAVLDTRLPDVGAAAWATRLATAAAIPVLYALLGVASRAELRRGIASGRRIAGRLRGAPAA